jgi:membrane protein involved in colicin uptake
VKKAMAEATPDWSQEQVKSYQDKVEAQKQAKLATLEKGSAAWDEAVTQANAANKSKIAAEHKTELEQIGKQSLAEEAANTRTRDEAMVSAQAGLDKAKADWQAAVAQANAKQPEKEGAAGESLADRIKRAISDVPDTLVGVRQKMDTVGTFNAAAAYGLGTGTVHERTAKATEQTARHTGQIARSIGRSLTFQ